MGPSPSSVRTRPNAFSAHNHSIYRLARRDIGSWASSSGDSIKIWIASCSSTGIFVATIFLSFLGCLIVLSLVWETLRKCRKRASGKGWKQLDAEKEIRKRMKEQGPEPLLRFRGPMHPPHPYDPPPRLTRQYRGPAPPPLPPVPTQYQQCAPQPYHNPLVGQLADSHGNSSRSYADTLPTSAASSTYGQPNSTSTDDKCDDSLRSEDTEPLILPSLQEPPGRVSSGPPTIELKRTWSLGSWLPSGKGTREEQKEI